MEGNKEQVKQETQETQPDYQSQPQIQQPVQNVQLQQVQQPQQMIQQQPQPQQYYQQPQVQMQPQQGQGKILYVQGPPMVIDNRDGLTKLMDMPALFIKEKVMLMEVVTGCEIENQYGIFHSTCDGQGSWGDMKMLAQEHSGWFERNCLVGGCRPFDISVRHQSCTPNDPNHNKPFLNLSRKCQFTCLCLNRPELTVHLVEDGQNRYLGKIVHPFKMCECRLNIYDAKGLLKYILTGECMQLGLWCKCPCEPCQTVRFSITSPTGEVLSRVEKVCKMFSFIYNFLKQRKGFIEALATDADNFFIEYPKKASAEDKALLMSCMLLLDFTYFENAPPQNNNRRNHY